MQTKVTYKNTGDIKPLLQEIRDLVYLWLKRDDTVTPLLLLLVGILNRTYELTDSAIWAIDEKRPLTSAQMLRALIETLGYIYYWKDKFAKASDGNELKELILQALMGSRKENDNFQQINILTAIDKASLRFDRLRRNYDDISEVVHPNAASHFYIGKAVNDEEMLAEFKLPFYDFKGTDELATINMTGECCCHIIGICKQLVRES